MSRRYRNYRAHLYTTRRANSKYRHPTRGIISFYQLVELLAVVIGIPVMLAALTGVIAILKGIGYILGYILGF